MTKHEALEPTDNVEDINHHPNETIDRHNEYNQNDEKTPVSFLLGGLNTKSPPTSHRDNTNDEFVDSCIDITSPTPSNSTSGSISSSRNDPNKTRLDQKHPTLEHRPAPLGCSGSSDEDEGAECDSE